MNPLRAGFNDDPKADASQLRAEIDLLEIDRVIARIERTEVSPDRSAKRAERTGNVIRLEDPSRRPVVTVATSPDMIRQSVRVHPTSRMLDCPCIGVEKKGPHNADARILEHCQQSIDCTDLDDAILIDQNDRLRWYFATAVSYTHLTLPTILRV